MTGRRLTGVERFGGSGSRVSHGTRRTGPDGQPRLSTSREGPSSTSGGVELARAVKQIGRIACSSVLPPGGDGRHRLRRGHSLSTRDIAPIVFKHCSAVPSAWTGRAVFAPDLDDVPRRTRRHRGRTRDRLMPPWLPIRAAVSFRARAPAATPGDGEHGDDEGHHRARSRFVGSRSLSSSGAHAPGKRKGGWGQARRAPRVHPRDQRPGESRSAS